MATPYIQEYVPNDVDDDDGMPPLVDNPYPSMTFTFSAEMTPITYSTDPTTFEVVSENPVELSATYSPPASPSFGPTRITHSKKRDASYIPRPPNAFILFRSHFIKAQHIPGKIEGNHSALSKIIGKYWKALPREEKEVWEAKAIVAQAEHRKKYPDWRFRPGANALAKVKDGPRKRTNRKGRGEAEKEERSREKRCAKIADLLVAGKTGADLEVAIEEYDCAHGGTQAIKKEGSGLLVVQFAENVTPATEPAQSQSQAQATIPAPASPAIQATPVDKAPRKQSRSLSPEAAHDSRFKMPLTAMFKRSSSAPAPSTRAGEDVGDLTVVPSAHQDVTLVGSTSPSEAFAAPHPVNAHEGKPPVESDITGVPDANTRLLDVKQHALVQPLPDSHSAVANFSSSGANVAQSLWTQTYTATYHDIDTYSPSVQSFDSDLEDNASPAQSPLAYTFDIAGDGESANFVAYSPTTCVPSFGAGSMMYGNSPSSYSSLKGWADDTTVKNTTYNHGSVPAFLPGTQYPMVYDPDRVMKDAFAAASTAPYEDWGVAFTTSESYRFSSARDIQSLQLYAQGWQDIARRQDDRQLF